MERKSFIEDTDKLLFDILETQRAILDELKRFNGLQVKLHSEEKTEPLKAKIEEVKTYPCKHCKGEHKRSIDIVNCGRKKNKEKR